MKKAIYLTVISIIILSVLGCPAPAGTVDGTIDGEVISVSVSGQDYGGAEGRTWAHASWIEDESGSTIQPLSITNFHFGKTGVPLPIWRRTESDTGDTSNVGAMTDLDYLGDDSDEIDAVTGPLSMVILILNDLSILTHL